MTAKKPVFRVEWTAKHPDGYVHSNHHDHTDRVQAEADLRSCAQIDHIVSARLVERRVVEETILIFHRDDEVAGAPGQFVKPA